MKIVFRADASHHIGSGHVMRCLTLADFMAAKGADCIFICRETRGNLIEFIKKRNYTVKSLPNVDDTEKKGGASFLSCTQEEDAGQCGTLLEALDADWLVVDHYALDVTWERLLLPYCGKILVIDDLANRNHVCSVLLDQTFGRDKLEYKEKVPSNTTVLSGSDYALLRPEFSQVREENFGTRTFSKGLQNILITLGGSDAGNVTGVVLESLRLSLLPIACEITVVLGESSPWVKEVKEQVEDFPYKVKVKVGVDNMAELMARSDFAIGAAGSTAWERCCLGLPCLMVVLADNQRLIAQSLMEYGAAFVQPMSLLREVGSLLSSDYFDQEKLISMSKKAYMVTDGLGVKRVGEYLINVQ